MPAGRAFAPGGVPFPLPLLARRAGAPNGKVARMALAFHRINACIARIVSRPGQRAIIGRSEEHTSELQSLMRIPYAVFCLKNKTTHQRVTFMRTHPNSPSEHSNTHNDT